MDVDVSPQTNKVACFWSSPTPLVSFPASLLFAFCVEMGSHCITQAVTLLSQCLGVMADYQFEWVERCLEMRYFWICYEDNLEHLACWTATVGNGAF